MMRIVETRKATTDGVDEQTMQRDVGAERKRIGDLIEEATVSPLLHLDDRALTSIKSLVRASDANTQAAFKFLLDRLKKGNSQVRYLAVLLIDQLFTRSKLFRSLLASSFETFLLHSVGYRADYPLPPPQERAVLLKKKSLEFVEKWKDMYGYHYKSIRLGYDFLKTTLRFESTSGREAATLENQLRRERQERTQELLKKKFQTLKAEYPDLKSDVRSTLDQIGECLAILAPPLSSNLEDSTQISAEVDEDEEFEVYGVESLRLLRDEVVEQDLLPQESRDNSAIFDILRDLYKILATRHLVSSQEWLTTLMRVDPGNDRQSRDALLREVIDLRNQLLKTRNECEGLGIKRIDSTSFAGAVEDGEEILWEEGGVLTLEHSVVDEGVSRRSPVKILGTVDTQSKLKGKETVDAAKQDLLKQAPVLPWGTFLDTWGSQSAFPANPRGLEFENHWGKVDYDVLIPAEKIAEISVPASYYKAPKLEIAPCLAPLRKGGLCQRKDIRICPLHGPKKLRDEMGNPIQEVDVRKEVPSTGLTEETIRPSTSAVDGDSAVFLESSPVGSSGRMAVPQGSDMGNKEFMDDDGEAGGSHPVDPVKLAAQAIENVRKNDEAKVTARRNRTKRTREHNDACLRDAANIRSSLGFEDTLVGNSTTGPRSTSKRPKGGLNALLRKKPTSKDRLTRRLLTGHVTGATINRLVRDEEAAYRESYPNQWTTN